MRTAIAGFVLAVTLASTACYSMKQVSVTDLSADRRTRVWMTRHDESVVIVNDAQMFRGKIVGFVDGKYRELPPTDFRDIQVRRLSAGRTLSLIGAGAASFVVAAVLLSGGEDHFDPCAGDDDCVEMFRSAR